MRQLACFWHLDGKHVVLWRPRPLAPTAPSLIVYRSFYKGWTKDKMGKRQGGFSALRPFIARGTWQDWEINTTQKKAKYAATMPDIAAVAGRSYYSSSLDTPLLELCLWLGGFFTNEQMNWGSNDWEQFPGYILFRDRLRSGAKITTPFVRQAMHDALLEPRPEFVMRSGRKWSFNDVNLDNSAMAKSGGRPAQPSRVRRTPKNQQNQPTLFEVTS